MPFRSLFSKSSLAVAVTFLLLLSMSCLSTPVVEKTWYYTLSPQVKIEECEVIDYTLGIRSVPTSKAYGLQMAYLDNNFEIAYRERERWVEHPSVVVSRAVQDAIVSTGRFADAGNAADLARPDLIMTGELRAFHENRSDEVSTAELGVHFQSRRAFMPGLLWSDTIMKSAVLSSSNALEFSETMNLLLEELSKEVAEAVIHLEFPPKDEEPVPTVDQILEDIAYKAGNLEHSFRGAAGELQGSLESIRVMIDQLKEDPSSLIRGRGKIKD